MTAPPEFEACQEYIRLRHNAERPAKAGLFYFARKGELQLNKLIITEKPSVAQAIAAVVGAITRKDGYFEGNGYVVGPPPRPARQEGKVKLSSL